MRRVQAVSAHVAGAPGSIGERVHVAARAAANASGVPADVSALPLPLTSWPETAVFPTFPPRCSNT